MTLPLFDGWLTLSRTPQPDIPRDELYGKQQGVLSRTPRGNWSSLPLSWQRGRTCVRPKRSSNSCPCGGSSRLHGAPGTTCAPMPDHHIPGPLPPSWQRGRASARRGAAAIHAPAAAAGIPMAPREPPAPSHRTTTSQAPFPHPGKRPRRSSNSCPCGSSRHLHGAPGTTCASCRTTTSLSGGGACSRAADATRWAACRIVGRVAIMGSSWGRYWPPLSRTLQRASKRSWRSRFRARSFTRTASDPGTYPSGHRG